MYRLVEGLDAEAFSKLCRRAFQEMRSAGITTVGEFHYLHHPATRPDFSFDSLVLDAARWAEIRIVLLNVYYATGGFGKPLVGAQCRFATLSASAYWKQMDLLERGLDSDMQSLGAVLHSVRAASLEDITAIHREAVSRQMVFHMHVEEQRREIEECLAVYGKRPLALLDYTLEIDARFTAVHRTHTTPDDLARFLGAGARVCVCPLTEGNMGEGSQTWFRPSLRITS